MTQWSMALFLCFLSVRTFFVYTFCSSGHLHNIREIVVPLPFIRIRNPRVTEKSVLLVSNLDRMHIGSLHDQVLTGLLLS